MENPDQPSVVENASLADIILLEANIDSFNAVETGISDARLLSILLKRDDGELYAGLHGHTWGGTCQVKLLWIAEPDRGRGLGRGCWKLRRARHGGAAAARSCLRRTAFRHRNSTRNKAMRRLQGSSTIRWDMRRSL
jgi:hypothetical protein